MANKAESGLQLPHALLSGQRHILCSGRALSCWHQIIFHAVQITATYVNDQKYLVSSTYLCTMRTGKCKKRPHSQFTSWPTFLHITRLWGHDRTKSWIQAAKMGFLRREERETSRGEIDCYSATLKGVSCLFVCPVGKRSWGDPGSSRKSWKMSPGRGKSGALLRLVVCGSNHVVTGCTQLTQKEMTPPAHTPPPPPPAF